MRSRQSVKTRLKLPNAYGYPRVKNVYYHFRNDSWSANWMCETEKKRKAKHFKVTKFGVKGAREKAIEWKLLMEAEQEIHRRHKDLMFHKKCKMWSVHTGAGETKLFTVKELGWSGARRAAVRCWRSLKSPFLSESD